MNAVKSFKVFGEPVDVLIPSEATNGSFAQVVQTCPPGGGPPPHSHAKEDEIFRALEGDFELFDGKAWHKLPAGEYAYMLRGSVHTFRNCGITEGRMLCIVTPGGLDKYLEAISPLAVPQDMGRLLEISGAQGIAFVMPGQPEVAAA